MTSIELWKLTRPEIIDEILDFSDLYDEKKLKRMLKTELISILSKLYDESWETLESYMTAKNFVIVNPETKEVKEVKEVKEPIKETYFERKSRLYHAAKRYNQNLKWSDSVYDYEKVLEDQRKDKENKRIEEENRIKEIIENFLTNDEPRHITFENLDERKLKFIISKLRKVNDYFIYIRRYGVLASGLPAAHETLPLNDINIERLGGPTPFDELIVKNEASDKEVIQEMLSNSMITIFKHKKSEVMQRLREKRDKRVKAAGAFFPYLNKTTLDLSRYGIYNKVDKNNYKNNCLIHALIQSGCFTKRQIQDVKLKVINRSVPVSHLKDIADILETTIVLKQEHDRHIRRFGDYEYEINLGLIREHYFLNESSHVNSFAIKNYEAVKHINKWQTLKSMTRHENRAIDSFNLIILMLENDLFTEIKLDNTNILKTQYYKEVTQDLSTLEYSDKCVKKIIPSIYNNVYLRLDSKFYEVKDGKTEEIKSINYDKTYVIFADDPSKFKFNNVNEIEVKYGYLIYKNDIEKIEEKTEFLGNQNLIYVRTYENKSFFNYQGEKITYTVGHTIYVMINNTRKRGEEYLKLMYEEKGPEFEFFRDNQDYKKLLMHFNKKKKGEKKEEKKEEKKKEKKESKVYYADFESTTEGKHKAYMCCATNGEEEKTFFGEDCGRDLLRYLEDGSITYFHNLGYDAQFLIKFLYVSKIIKTGSQIKLLKGSYDKKTLIFRDSAAMISSPLKSFSEFFKLDVKKEIMPYSLYNEENINKNKVKLEEALEHIKSEEKEEFLEVAEPYIKNNYFDHMSYAQFYCLQDCRVLCQGFETFRKWIKEAFNLDTLKYVSLPSLANAYLIKEGCFDGVYSLSSTPRLFIQKCVSGGRCMTRDNVKWHVIGKQAITPDNKNNICGFAESIEYNEECIISDFDGVSLYPSAMVRMPGFLKGKPKVLKDDQLNMDFLNEQSGYFIEINNVKLSEFLHFPLQSEKDKNGIRNYKNEFENSLFIDKIALEDLIKFQGATFNIVRGYYFNEGHNNKINQVIQYCFNERLKQKSKSNPIEQVYKLLMNASYGKTILKAVETDLKFTNTKKQHDKFLFRNHNFIKEYSEIAKDKHVYKIQKSVLTHFNTVHVGVEILSMSKRIMNEVMCLAEDLDIDIFYQDTDSMHILDRQIETLADAFKKIYKRELIGEQLGQFHTDFSVKDTRTNKKIKDITAIESYFLGKKCYIDKLTCKDEDFMSTKHHIRMKGVSEGAILIKGDPMVTYDKLFKGESVKFDLAEGKPIFKKNKDFSCSSQLTFIRELKF